MKYGEKDSNREYTSVDENDHTLINDVSDTTDSSKGKVKWIKYSVIKAWIQTFTMPKVSGAIYWTQALFDAAFNAKNLDNLNDGQEHVRLKRKKIDFNNDHFMNSYATPFKILNTQSGVITAIHSLSIQYKYADAPFSLAGALRVGYKTTASGNTSTLSKIGEFETTAYQGSTDKASGFLRSDTGYTIPDNDLGICIGLESSGITGGKGDFVVYVEYTET